MLLATALLGLVGCSAVGGDTGPARLRVLVWNIHHGRGLDGRVDLERIAATIRAHAPDLVALQEVDVGVRRSGGRDLAGELARATGTQAVFRRNIDFQGGEYGNAVLSRLPVVAVTNHPYAMLRPGEQRGLLRVTVEHPVAGALAFWNTHLDSRSDDAERRSCVEEILAALADEPAPVILVGDLNATPDSAPVQRLAAAFDDAWRAGVPAHDPGHTYPADGPRKRIDYALVERGRGWRAIEARVLTSLASDHAPLLVVLECTAGIPAGR